MKIQQSNSKKGWIKPVQTLIFVLIVASLVFGSEIGLVALAPPGDLDATFGIGGRVRTDFPGSNLDGAFAVAIHPDGKIVTAGRALGSAVQQDFDFALARYNVDGSPDNSF